MPPCAQAVFESAPLRFVITATEPCCRRLQGKGQPGDPAADDDEIVFLHRQSDVVDQPSLAKEHRDREQ